MDGSDIDVELMWSPNCRLLIHNPLDWRFWFDCCDATPLNDKKLIWSWGDD